MRQAESLPILLKWAEEQQAVTTPKSKLGQAITYLLNQQVALEQYIKDGALPIDNTAVERIHRAAAVKSQQLAFLRLGCRGANARLFFIPSRKVAC